MFFLCAEYCKFWPPLLYGPKSIHKLLLSCGWAASTQAHTEPETPFCRIGHERGNSLLDRDCHPSWLLRKVRCWQQWTFFPPWKPYLLFIGIVFISVHIALVQVNEAIDQQDEGALMAGLNRPALSLLEVLPQNSSWYLLQLCESKEQKMQVIELNRYYVSAFLAGFNPERNCLYTAFQHHLWEVL